MPGIMVFGTHTDASLLVAWYTLCQLAGSELEARLSPNCQKQVLWSFTVDANCRPNNNSFFGYGVHDHMVVDHIRAIMTPSINQPQMVNLGKWGQRSRKRLPIPAAADGTSFAILAALRPVPAVYVASSVLKHIWLENPPFCYQMYIIVYIYVIFEYIFIYNYIYIYMYYIYIHT